MATRDMGLREKYPSNSNKSKMQRTSYNQPIEDVEIDEEQDKKQVKQVTNAKVRKKGFLKRMGRSIIEDSIETAKEKAYEDIIVPGFKALIFDTVTEIFDIMLFGGSDDHPRGYSRRTERTKRGDRTSYSGYYEDKNNSRNVRREERYYEPDDIIVDTRAEAWDVLNALDDLIQRYGQASVADFYDIVGVSDVFTDNKYGWTNIRGASVKPVRDGFMIMLPRTRLLDD